MLAVVNKTLFCVLTSVRSVLSAVTGSISAENVQMLCLSTE